MFDILVVCGRNCVYFYFMDNLVRYVLKVIGENVII